MYIELNCLNRITSISKNKVENSGWTQYDGELPDNWQDYSYYDGEIHYDPIETPLFATTSIEDDEKERIHDLEDAICELASLIAEVTQ